MYVKGMGAVATNPGYARRRIVRPPLVLVRRRGMGDTSCPPGQTPTNMYDGSVKCCGGPTPESDPCSYLNTPGYIASQNQVQANAIAGDAGPMNAAILAQLAQYPQNVQTDALNCVSNPGSTFTDAYGMTVTCPAPSTSPVPGINVSIYSPAQIAAMIAGSATPSYETPINTVDTRVIPTPVVVVNKDPVVQTNGGGSGSGSSGGSGGSGGGNTGGGGGSSCVAPNTLVNGVCTAPAAPATGTDLVSQIETALSNSVTIGGMSIPVWALVGGGFAALWFFGGKH